MNKILTIIVIILIPLAVITKNEEVPVFQEENLDNITLEVPITKKEEEVQVALSSNDDKTDAFYMDLEEYVIGVVAGEMPASFNMEALKAQAVASRSFALYKMSSIKDYVLSTTINDQVYLSIDEMKSKWGDDFNYYYERVKEAVNSTKGEILTYNGSVASTYYFAISNGYTDDALTVFNENKDYLVSVPSTWDKNYQSYKSVYTLNKTDFCNKLEISCDTIQISNITRADNHYVRSITINNKTFSGQEVFRKLNLKSTDFEIDIKDKVSITTYGFGHGVGMSQYGAQGMSNEGKNYIDILKHYYQNTEIEKI